MKTKFWLMTFGAMISTSLLAQPTATAPSSEPVYREMTQPPATPAQGPKTTAPVKKKVVKKPAVKKPVAAKPAASVDELRTVPLVPGPATVVAMHVNVRAQGRIKSEVLTHLTKGEAVTVIEEITLKKSALDEPSAWAKIVLPANAPAWINTRYIDPANKTVTARKLNVRGGPGENYSVIGLLHKGDAVGEIITQGDWTKIEPPTNAFAFVAAQYLQPTAPAEMPPTVPTAPPETIPTNTEPAPTPTPVVESTPVVIAPTEMTLPPGEIPIVAAPVPAPVTEEPLPKRIVAHEGVVHGTVSIQAPTPYALVAPDTGVLVDYLYTTSTDLDLSRYKGLHIIVTGEEALDKRWKNTPVITIQKIQVID
jgi:uncharacterized protein YgiM (DUF1202 family)